MADDPKKSPWYAFAKAIRQAARELDRIEARKKDELEGQTPGGSGRA